MIQLGKSVLGTEVPERFIWRFHFIDEGAAMEALIPMDGSSVVPPGLVVAVTNLAERHADLTANWLESVGYPPGAINVPAAFLLELAAVLQLGEWERTGVLHHLDVVLPTRHQAADELAARTKLGSKEFQGPDATRLSSLVNNVWIERFAWDGPSLLKADIVFGECDDEAFVEQLAEFLWQHHVELQKLTDSETCDER